MRVSACTCLIAATIYASTLADTPPEQQTAIDALKGIPSNLQKNRDGTVRFVRFSKAIVTNEHVAHVAAFQDLDYLAVVVPSVTDDGLRCVEKLTKLDTLFLSDSGASDETLARLAHLTKLEHLYLDRTKITDEGLAAIPSITTLRTLSMDGTGITDSGLTGSSYYRAVPSGSPAP